MSETNLLNIIREPSIIKKLSPRQLDRLAADIRARLIETVSRTGGHLASNLGVVELTIALLRTLDLPGDKIVWDVGHQCYPYKLLTGRAGRFGTLRQEDGLSGFPKTEESEYDAFLAGHASTSIAAAYGLKRAMTLQNNPRQVVAVIGDGSLTGGMAFEGLNNVGKSGENLIIILNDNEMAISRNEGALARYLSVIRAKPSYYRAKRAAEAALCRIPVVGEGLRDLAAGSKSILKHAIYAATFFEELGFTYLGPVDGHDTRTLCDLLERAKAIDGPTFLHIKTVKGKGYPHAEANPGAFHGVSTFNVATGEPRVCASSSFSEVFGRELVALGRENDKVCAVTAAMEHGTGLQYFAREFKAAGRFYDVGIAEEFGVTFAAALAAGGMAPVFAVYSTFLQRGYDQLLHDAAIERRHVVFGVDRAGLVGDDGETHQGLFDAAFLSTIPGVTVYAPSNYSELRAMLRRAVNECDGPVAVRYPRGAEPARLSEYQDTGRPFDHIEVVWHGCVVVTYGRLFDAVRQAACLCDRSFAVIKLNRVTPIDDDAVTAAAAYKRVVFVEEGIASGGIGEQFLARLSLMGYRGQTALRAISGFVPQGKVDSALRRLGLDAEGIARLAERKDPQ